MTQRQKQLIENYVRRKVRSMLNENPSKGTREDVDAYSEMMIELSEILRKLKDNRFVSNNAKLNLKLKQLRQIFGEVTAVSRGIIGI